ncbi:hypothetical protein Cgig2_006380 [Carnegiea gigantea]|uniref:Uncharacterized protein n=1 Tax=Carnegiea gigantea TaxID=171969 RepID=A0A9Q1K4H7_9CARY|nr:hypothetical protein Cgig2_006380 [Carnegiea gigantea]
MSQKERSRILQHVSNIIDYRSLAIRGPSSLGPTRQFGQELIKLFTMSYGMKVMTSHIYIICSKDYQITLLLYLAFLTVLNLGMHFFFMTCGQRTRARARNQLLHIHGLLQQDPFHKDLIQKENQAEEGPDKHFPHPGLEQPKSGGGLLTAIAISDTYGCLSQQVDYPNGNAELWLRKSQQRYLYGHQDISLILVGYKRAPYVAWGTICTPRKYGGLG